ncbi:MAG: PKD domain-containing protein [Flavobacteriales bacterium]|nr:PKD domain-containing protein [Flavobacteriales bacterium]
MRTTILSFTLLSSALLSAQSITPSVVGTAGGYGTAGATTLNWTVGEMSVSTLNNGSNILTQGYHQPAGKLIYYSRANGNVSDPIWSRTPTGPAGPANFIPRASMVVQTGHVVHNTGTVDLRDVLVEGGGSLQLDPGSAFNVHGRNATFLGVLYGSDGSVMSLVGNKPVVLTTASKPNVWDLEVNTPQGTTANGEMEIRGTLQLIEGDLNATAALFTLRSYATTTGRLGPVPPEASYTGNLKIERYIPGGATNWRLLGSPITSRRVQHWQDDFITAGYPGSQYPGFSDPPGSGILWPSIRWYDETHTGPAQNDGITGVSSDQQALVVGQGFAAWSGDALGGTAPFVVDLGGAPPVIATAPITLPMSWTDTGAPLVDGWNLVSNPVPSAIAFDQVARGADVEDYVTFYNPANGNAAVFDIGLGFGTNGATNTIQSSQGFFLKASGPAVTTTVDESDKINDNSGGVFGGFVPDPTPLVRLRMSSAINTFSDESIVAFDIGSPQFDPEDALKYVLAHPSAPQVATLASTGESLAINAFGATSSPMSIPVSVNAGVSGTYTMEVTAIGELGIACLGLEDLVNGALIPLIDGAASYDFTLVGSAPAATRFVLRVLAPQASFTSTSSVEVNTPIAFSNNSIDGVSYAWDFGDGSTSDEAEPMHTYTAGGTYDVTLTASTGACSSTFTQSVTVTSPALPVAVRVMLQGAYDVVTGLLDDDLRAAGLLPLLEPYTAMGYAHIGGGGEFVLPSAFSITGSDAIVDWVVIELRDDNDPSIVVETRSGLLQRDGQVVAVNGSSPLSFLSAPGSYRIAVHHRNHLGAMTSGSISLGASTTAIDFTDGSRPTYGIDAQVFINGTRALWSGDVNGDGQLKYTGQDNDRDPILVEIGGSVPTSISTGYKSEDVNMDGIVKYVGEGNDRDPILQNVGGNVPTAIRAAQMP